jgi:hypothetical protein
LSCLDVNSEARQYDSRLKTKIDCLMQLSARAMSSAIESAMSLSNRGICTGLCVHGDDAIDVMVGRLKTRMRQSLARGRIWTEGYCGEPLFDDVAVEQAQEYVARHEGCRMTDGKLVGVKTPGGAGG